MKKIKLVNMVAIHFLEKIYQEFCFLICKFTTIFTLKIFLKKIVLKIFEAYPGQK